MINLNMDPSNISLLLFGAILISGLIGGELAKKSIILPQICGYLLVGLILGPSILNFVTAPMLKIANIFVDICFGIILFELGKNIYIKSLINDPWLLIGGISSCALSFVFILITMILFNFDVAKSAIVAAIGITTSPAVIYMVARELKVDGPIVRRTKSLVAINNVIGLLTFVTIIPYLNYTLRDNNLSIWAEPIYLLTGSIGLSMLTFVTTFILSMLVGKIESRQFILIIAIIILQIGVCYILDLSAIITLLFYGIFIKNLNYRNRILNIEFGYIEDLFFLMLFVITGANLSWVGIDKYLIPVCAVLLARSAAQFITIYYSSRKSGYTQKQSALVSIALAPIAVSALGISQTTSKLYPEFGAQISQVILISLLIMQFIGPILTQYAFKRSDN